MNNESRTTADMLARVKLRECQIMTRLEKKGRRGKGKDNGERRGGRQNGAESHNKGAFSFQKPPVSLTKTDENRRNNDK
jgi:hypothetical protein